ncbi:MAG: transglutaminase-like domain-containing protein [Victivallales bacterium]|jgi:hypothetical protein|nr:transglutaminase-like domain-containing protein [Victivallales bacterium]
MDQTRKIVLYSAAILLPAAFYFGAIAELPHILVITFILLVLSAIKPKGWRISDRSIIYLTLSVLAITLFGNYFSPIKLDRFGFMATLTRPALSIPFALYCGALAAGFRRREYAIGIASAAAMLTFGLGGDVRVDELLSSKNSMVNWIASVFPYFFCGTMSISLLAILWGSRSGSKRGSVKRFALLFFAVIAIGGVVALELWVYRQNERIFRRWESVLLRIGVRQFYRSESTHMQIGTTPNLMLAIPPEFGSMSDRVALRVVGKTAPGYLRGRSFYQYYRGVWRNGKEIPGAVLPMSMANQAYFAEKLCAVTRLERTRYKWDIYPDESLQLRTLFFSANIVSVSLVANRILQFPNGMLEVEQFVRDGGYSVYVDTPETMSAFSQPETPGQEFLVIPREIRTTLSKITEELKLSKCATDAERFRKLKEYFDQKFQYSLDWRGSKPEPVSGENNANSNGAGFFRPRWRFGDPVKFFLTEQRRAHCELFASATALLLRSAGIPSRYVTGIVCNEPHPSGKYFIARYGDSHAWVEAYDRQLKRWVLLDTTPPAVTAVTLREDTWRERLDSAKEYLRFAWAEMLGKLNRGHLIEGIIAFLMLCTNWGFYIIKHPLWGTLIALLLLTGVGVLLRRYAKRPDDHLTPEKRKLQKQYRKLLCKLRRGKIIGSKSTPTAVELLATVKSHPSLSVQQRDELSAYLESYIIERYSI